MSAGQDFGQGKGRDQHRPEPIRLPLSLVVGALLVEPAVEVGSKLIDAPIGVLAELGDLGGVSGAYLGELALMVGVLLGKTLLVAGTELVVACLELGGLFPVMLLLALQSRLER